MVPVGEGSGLMRWAMLSGMFMVSGEIWAWTSLTGDSGTFLGSFLSLDRAVNVIFMLVLGNRKQHLEASGKAQTSACSSYADTSSIDIVIYVYRHGNPSRTVRQLHLSAWQRAQPGELSEGAPSLFKYGLPT